MKGIFITFEGGEACGKTTQLKLLQQYFKEKGTDALFVREPGGTALGESVRHLLLTNEDIQMCGKTELLLFMASRTELYEKTIKPALDAGRIVVADRYYDSTVAYQGSARGVMDMEDVLSLNLKFLDGLKPDLTVYLKIDPKEAFLRKENMPLDKMEREGLTFHQKVADGYDYMVQKHPDRFIVIDATQSIEDIHKQIVTAVEKLATKSQESEN